MQAQQPSLQIEIENMQQKETTVREHFDHTHLPTMQYQQKDGGTTTTSGKSKKNKSTQITFKVTRSSIPSGSTVENTVDPNSIYYQHLFKLHQVITK
jgi:hypothetical protein